VRAAAALRAVADAGQYAAGGLLGTDGTPRASVCVVASESAGSPSRVCAVAGTGGVDGSLESCRPVTPRWSPRSASTSAGRTPVAPPGTAKGRPRQLRPMRYRGAAIDVDGTLLRGEEPIPGAGAAVRALRDAGVALAFVTNNPTRGPAAVADRLEDLGVPASPAAVVTSGTVTRRYLAATHPDDAVYVVGEDGLRDQLDGVSTTDDPHRADVFLGSVSRSFGYDDLVAALRAFADGETAFVGTDPDRTIPAADEELPGSGAVLGAVEVTTGRSPTVLGKPSAHAARALGDVLGADLSDCLVVGDRRDTDVALGEAAGADTALVLTGVTDEGELGDGDGPEPDHVLDSVADLPALLEA